MKPEYLIYKHVYTQEQCRDLARIAEETQNTRAVDRSPEWKR